MSLAFAAAEGSLVASAVTTDFPDVNLIKNLEYNIELNNLQGNCVAEVRSGCMSCIRSSPGSSVLLIIQGFVWGTPTDSLTSRLPSSSSARFDILLLADLVFNHSQHIALLRSCEALLKVHERAASDSVDAPVALCFYAHHRPTPELIAKDEGFLETASRRGWEVRLIVQDHEAGVCLLRLSSLEQDRANVVLVQLAFPEDGGDPAIRRMVKGWTMKWTGKAVMEEQDD